MAMNEMSKHEKCQGKNLSIPTRMVVGFTILLLFVIVDFQSNSVAQDVGTARVVLDQPTREYLETQAWWWMARQRAYPLAIEEALADGSLDKAHRRASDQVRAERIQIEPGSTAVISPIGRLVEKHRTGAL